MHPRDHATTRWLLFPYPRNYRAIGSYSVHNGPYIQYIVSGFRHTRPTQGYARSDFMRTYQEVFTQVHVGTLPGTLPVMLS